MVDFNGNNKTVREYDDEAEAEAAVRRWLDHYPVPSQDRSLWDTESVKKWGNKPASSAQIGQIRRMLGDDAEAIDVEHLTKREAAAVLDNAFEKQENAFAEIYGLCPKCGQALKLTKNKKSFTCTSNHWSQDGSWTLVSGCGTTFKVRADGHCIKPADLKAFARTATTYGAGRGTPSNPPETPVTSVPSDASDRPMMTPSRFTAPRSTAQTRPTLMVEQRSAPVNRSDFQ